MPNKPPPAQVDVARRLDTALAAQAGIDGEQAKARTVAGIYTHLHEVWSIVPCRLVGWLAFWGYSPRFLHRGDVKDCKDPEQWMDEETWRDYVGGSADQYVLRAVEKIEEPAAASKS